MANEVEIRVVGKDAGGKKTIDDAAKSGDKLTQSVGNIGKVIGGTFLSGMAQNAFRRLNSFMQESIELAIEQRRVEAQLDATLRSTSHAAGLNAGQIKAMASEYQSLTNFGDEAVISSSNVLLTFTKIGGDIFPRAQKAILDVSTALGMDLQGATVQVGKALNDPIKGLTTLSRAGVQFTEQQREQIRTMVEAGDVAGAQTVILGELETQFGGSAEAAVAADGGITQMNNSIGDMQEEIGRRLIPLVAQWTQAKLNLLEVLTSLPGPIQLVVAAVAVLSLGFLVLAPRILATRDALVLMGISARTANRALGIVGIALTVAAGAVAYFSTQQREGTTATDDMTASLDAQTGAVTANTRELVINRLEQAGALQAAQALGVGLDDLTEAILAGGDVMTTLNRLVDDADNGFNLLDGQMTRTTETSGDQARAWMLLQDAVGATSGELEDSKGRWERQTEATAEATGAVYDHIDSLTELSDQLKAQVDPVFAYTRATQALEDAQQAVIDAERDHTRDSPQYRQALIAESEAALAVLHAAGQLGDEFTGELSEAQKQMMRDAGASEAAIDALADELARTKAEADRLDNTRASVYVNLHTSYTSSGTPTRSTAPGGRGATERAHGGVIGGLGAPNHAAGGGPRGSLTWVGEQGPELVDLPFGSKVIPAGQSQAMARAGFGSDVDRPIVVEIAPRSDGTRLGDLLVEILRHALRNDDSVRADLRRAVS